jgi:hypothetical protein
MKTGFFEEKPGVWSFVRLASAVLIGLGCLIALLEVNYCMWFDGKYVVHTGLIDSLVFSGLGGKITQKIFGEKKNTTDESNQEG